MPYVISILRVKIFCVDATSKDELEGYTRGWPMQTDCEREVVASLVKRGIVKMSQSFLVNLRYLGRVVA